MVDPQRKSVRDVLRNPAGLNDTLFDMVAMTTTADRPPTSQTKAVSREVMAKVDSEVAKFEALVEGRHRPAQRGARQGSRAARDGGVGSHHRDRPHPEEGREPPSRRMGAARGPTSRRKSDGEAVAALTRVRSAHAQAPVRKNGRTRHGR